MSDRGAAAGKEEQERQEEQQEQQEDDPYRSRWRSALHFVSTLSWAPDWHTSRRQLCAVDSGSSGSSAGSAERLILLSYNVNFGLPGRSREGQKVLQGVRESQADCVALQESTASFEEVFREELGDVYPHQHWNNAGAAGGAAFLSKYPLNDVRTLDLSEEVEGSWFETLFASVDTPGLGRILLANVHLRPPVEAGGGADLSTYATTNRVRLDEVRRILEFCQERDGTPIVLGDFNEPEHFPAVKLLKSRGFTDVLEEHVDSSIETHRWPFGKLGLMMKNRLDHILYPSTEFVCVDATVIPGYATGASDHQPLVAVFEHIQEGTATAQRRRDSR